MIIFDDYAHENKTEHNLKFPYIPGHLYIFFPDPEPPINIILIGGSGSGKKMHC